MLDRAWCAAVVTAAGASSRMGRAKALIEIEGRPLLGRQLAALEGFAQRIVVLGAHAGEILEALDPELQGTVVVSNPNWETGRSSSLRAGFAEVSGQVRGILVAGVDQPIDPDVVTALLEAFDPAVHSHAVPRVGERAGHPLLVSAVLRDPHLLGLPDDRTLKDLLRAFESSRLEVSVPSRTPLADLNTLEDVEAFSAETPRPAREA